MSPIASDTYRHAPQVEHLSASSTATPPDLKDLLEQLLQRIEKLLAIALAPGQNQLPGLGVGSPAATAGRDAAYQNQLPGLGVGSTQPQGSSAQSGSDFGAPFEHHGPHGHRRPGGLEEPNSQRFDERQLSDRPVVVPSATAIQSTPPVAAPSPAPAVAVVAPAAVTPTVASATAAPGAAAPTAQPVSGASSVAEAARNTAPKFLPVLRGDEAAKDSKIQTEADFGRAADEVAREYGLDPNAFRAQLQAETGAFTQDFRVAMKHEGDVGRAADNNTSIGLGQISRKYLDGREWSDGGPGNARVGSQVVTTQQYEDSPTVQLRMAASNVAQRIADHGGLEGGLSYYVSGNANANPSGQTYIANIDKWMKDPQVTDIGR